MSTDCISSQDIGFSEPLGPVVGHVSPSEQLITLTLGQLQDLVTQAIERATAPLVERLEATETQLQAVQARLDAIEERGVGPGEGGEGRLRAHQDGQGSHFPTPGIVQDLQAENHALKSELEALQETTARERAYDRQRIAKLEHKEPQPLQRDRGEILRALIAVNGGKMLAKEARQKMRLSKSSFSQLLATMKDDLGVKGYHQDKRNLVLFIK